MVQLGVLCVRDNTQASRLACQIMSVSIARTVRCLSRPAHNLFSLNLCQDNALFSVRSVRLTSSAIIYLKICVVVKF